MLSIHDHNTSHKRKAAVHRQGTVVYQMETVVTEAAYVGHFYWGSSLKTLPASSVSSSVSGIPLHQSCPALRYRHTKPSLCDLCASSAPSQHSSSWNPARPASASHQLLANLDSLG